MNFIMLVIVFIVAYRKLERNDRLNRSFLLAVAGVMLGLISESASTYFNGKTGTFSIILNNFFSTIIFVIAPMIAFYFFIFIFYLLLPDNKIKKNLYLLMALPVIISVSLALLSPLFGFYFQISDTGVYSRGNLFLLSAFFTYIYLITGVVLILINIKKMVVEDLLLILAVGIIPVIGGIVQSLFYGLLTMWSSAGVALILGYLFLQDRMIRLDSLTGAWNRESFYYTYSRRIQLNPDKKFGAIYFDIDNLKEINDNYGHLEGDKAIKLVLERIREILTPASVICRLGGDEFIILCDCVTEADMEEILENIKANFKIDSEVVEKDYKLECSFGTAIYSSEFTSINAFISKLDMLMYEDKFSKKSKVI
jgi:diguanylate cyclase (GGDEF)-like protein